MSHVLPRKDKYSKKLLKYKVDVEEESEDYDHDEEVEKETTVGSAARLLIPHTMLFNLLALECCSFLFNLPLHTYTCTYENDPGQH